MSGAGSFNISDLFSLEGPLAKIGLTGLGPVFGYISLLITLLGIFGVFDGGGGGGSAVPGGAGGAGDNQAAVATCQSAIDNAKSEFESAGTVCNVLDFSMVNAYGNCNSCRDANNKDGIKGAIYRKLDQQCQEIQKVCSAAALGSGGTGDTHDTNTTPSAATGTGQYYYGGGYYGSLGELNGYLSAQGQDPLSEQEAAKYLQSSPSGVDDATLYSCGCIEQDSVDIININGVCANRPDIRTCPDPGPNLKKYDNKCPPKGTPLNAPNASVSE